MAKLSAPFGCSDGSSSAKTVDSANSISAEWEISDDSALYTESENSDMYVSDESESSAKSEGRDIAGSEERAEGDSSYGSTDENGTSDDDSSYAPSAVATPPPARRARHVARAAPAPASLVVGGVFADTDAATGAAAAKYTATSSKGQQGEGPQQLEEGQQQQQQAEQAQAEQAQAEALPLPQKQHDMDQTDKAEQQLSAGEGQELCSMCHLGAVLLAGHVVAALNLHCIGIGTEAYYLVVAGAYTILEPSS